MLVARANDGQIDTLICGPGNDIAFARAEDVVDPTCETVYRVAAAEAEPADEDQAPAAEVAPTGDNDARGDQDGSTDLPAQRK